MLTFGNFQIQLKKRLLLHATSAISVSSSRPHLLLNLLLSPLFETPQEYPKTWSLRRVAITVIFSSLSKIRIYSSLFAVEEWNDHVDYEWFLPSVSFVGSKFMVLMKDISMILLLSNYYRRLTLRWFLEMNLHSLW